MGVPVPAAKQLLQGSSSPLNLSHLLLVLRHWSQAKEREISRDERAAGAGRTCLCCSFSYWKPRLGVGHRRICRDREGKALQTWRRNNQSRERRKKTEERPPSHAAQWGSVIGPWHAINALSPVPGQSASIGCTSLHFFIFVFHSKGRNAQMPPYYRDTSTTFNIHRLSPPQPCIVASVLWDASVAK